MDPASAIHHHEQETQQQPPKTNDPHATKKNTPPSRYIYTETDMNQFRKSPARKNLLSFVTALGRSCAPPPNTHPSFSANEQTTTTQYQYDPSQPLRELSPSLASFHGSLRAMADLWLTELPPDRTTRARFGNPMFRTWHDRLIERSDAIISCLLDCRDDDGGGGHEEDEEGFLDLCAQRGYAAAANPPAADDDAVRSRKHDNNDDAITTELAAYLHSSFGHPTRLDYGTGHESSFFVFLYALFKIGCFDDTPRTATTTAFENAPCPRRLAAVALSITSQYLRVTRQLQSEYMLEPAGSHGVWGLDDYHCLPFYFGACQLVGNDGDIQPRCIHDDRLLERECERLMYFGCIRYIKSLKKGVPFFESSPMLDDISSLDSWTRVAKGLMKLYEGEVLEKLPVVQHFVFGNIFKANWTPSQEPRTAPTRTFINGPHGDECIAPWAVQRSGANVGMIPPPTRAPWAK
eukprot:CAMPEP_0172507786 /NCGR_PEP_ID=MMETSP1066-20121228/206503_1 /TAXON_ID=671091 /ORGANISM="Coscinodiscus wailesii, Strain CCMP2513" /LENGTH=462 /DNA_ID=CAMNT_0013285469 /DNA_START=88 /DNA_END=1476 /DNA_ORIENTATION=+